MICNGFPCLSDKKNPCLSDKKKTQQKGKKTAVPLKQ